MSFFFEGNSSEPSDVFGPALKGIQQGLKLGLLIGKSIRLVSLAVPNVLKARQEQEIQRQLEERWRNQQKR